MSYGRAVKCLEVAEFQMTLERFLKVYMVNVNAANMKFIPVVIDNDSTFKHIPTDEISHFAAYHH